MVMEGYIEHNRVLKIKYDEGGLYRAYIMLRYV